MDIDDIAEEHRKYLDITDNPGRISTSAVFKLVSDGLLKLNSRLHEVKISLTKIGTKQETTDKKVDHLEDVIDNLADRIGGRVMELETDLHVIEVKGAKTEGTIDERFKWQEKTQKVLMALILFAIGLLLVAVGVPIPFP